MPTCPNCSHTWTNPNLAYSVDGSVVQCPSWEYLRTAIQEYVHSRGGVTIVSHDHPMTRQVGFQTADQSRTWRLNLTHLKEGMHDMGVYKSYVAEAAGRAQIAENWTRGVEPTVPYVREVRDSVP